MKKNERLSGRVEAWVGAARLDLPKEYLLFFECFNSGAYYEAHDVLEHLWLRCRDTNRSFYQGLIQLAGAFVHFKQQMLSPEHPVHGRRIGPGGRLLQLAENRFAGYPIFHLSLDLLDVRGQCAFWRNLAAAGLNPLRHPVRVELFPEGVGRSGG